MGIIAIGTVFFSHSALAQTSQPPATTVQNQSTIQAVQQGLSENFSTTSTSCQQALPARSCFISSAKSAGVTTSNVPFAAGDQVKCALSGTTQYCEVKNANGTSYYNAGPATWNYATTDSSGAITGGAIGVPNGTLIGDCAAGGASNCATEVTTKAATSVASAAASAAAAAVQSALGKAILDTVAMGILTFANWLLGIAGVLFNLVMVYGVFQFANVIGNSPGVLTAWGILRDLANMALLFGFIFMGIATILDTGGVQNFTAKRALPSLLIFAILMNFSLFTAEAMIDVSNALSSTMYTQANTDPCTTGDTTNCGVTYGLAGHIMQSTGLAGIWAIKTDTPAGATLTTLLGLALFATIGAIVFFAAAIMLAIRVVVLTLLMVVSPIGFAGMAIPPLRKFAGDWWTRVIHQAFYAPIMLLLILISLKIADSFTTAGGNNGLGSSTLAAAVTGQDATIMGVFLVFMLVIGFMVASLIVANRFGAVGATAAVGFGKKVVLGSYGGIAGYTGRRTIGAGANWAQKKYNSSVASGRLKVLSGTKVDDMVLAGFKKGTDARFGSSKSFKENKEHHEARHKELEKVKRLDEVGTVKTDDEMRKALKQLSDAELAESSALKKGSEQLERIARNLSSEKFEKLMGSDKLSDDVKDEMRNARFEDLGAALTNLSNASTALAADPSNPALKTAQTAAKKALEAKVKSTTGKDLGQLAQASKWNGMFQNKDLVAALSDDQFKDAQKNTNLTTSQIDDLVKVREGLATDPAVVSGKITGMNAEEINKLKSEVLSNPTVLRAMSGRKLALIDPSKIGNDTHLQSIVTYIKTNALVDPTKVADFKAQYNADPRVKQRWSAYGINL